MKNNKNINEKIKSYESLMHRVLHNYNVKEDYEDLLQEMRIVIWKALINKNPHTMYIENTNTKFTTYLYTLMENRLKDIFKIEYKMNIDNKSKNKSLKNRTKKNIARPKLLEDLSFEQQINIIKNNNDANSIRFKTDLETFNNNLNNIEKEIWKLYLEGWTQKDMAKKLKKINIYKDRSTISRKLKVINSKFIKFINDGEL